jgi:hypothetical protein
MIVSHAFKSCASASFATRPNIGSLTTYVFSVPRNRQVFAELFAEFREESRDNSQEQAYLMLNTLEIDHAPQATRAVLP